MLLTKETKTTLLGSTITFTMDQRQVSLTNFFQPRFENNEVSSSMHVLLTNPAGLEYGEKLFHDMFL